MRADISRSTFRPGRQYTGVVQQQGRVVLDAEVNEQSAIHTHALRTFITDLIGRHAGPMLALQRSAFLVSPIHDDTGKLVNLALSPFGRYYVDGIAVDATRAQPPVLAHEPASPTASPTATPTATDPAPGTAASSPTEDPWTYLGDVAHRQPFPDRDVLPDFPFIVGLEVRERLVTDASDRALREVALGPGAPDGSARRQVVWRVIAVPATTAEHPEEYPPTDVDTARAWFDSWADRHARGDGRLAAATDQPPADPEPCTISPDSRYRGPENQLYRVEIHDGGEIVSGIDTAVRFVWSRDNGSAAYPIVSEQGATLTLGSLRGPDRHELAVGDWVEYFDDESVARGIRYPLVQVGEIQDRQAGVVLLTAVPHGTPSAGSGTGGTPAPGALLRRWDQRDPEATSGGLRPEASSWDDLEDGIRVQFAPGRYRAGDHWLVPARTVTGGVEWPQDNGTPLLLEAEPAQVHYAPLAWVHPSADAATPQLTDLRSTFDPLA